MTRPILALLASLLAWFAPSAPALADGQDPAIVQAVVRDFLLEQVAHLGGHATISVDVPGRASELPACDEPVAFLTGGTRLRPRLSVGLRCLSPQPWTLYVPAAISVQGSYYVAARSIRPGEPIGPEDLEARQGELITLAAGIAVDTAAVIGSVATQRIAAGQPIRMRALRAPDVVQRGTVVRILARGPGFVVTGEGEAMGNAAPGASVRVRTASGQIVSGIVQDAHTVEVPM
jgi:flagella basal body P-ring formation protein FlgA